jgi:tellurite resistance protein TerC
MWVGFNLFVLAMLALDLGVFHRKAHAVSVKEATLWSVVWIALAMLFNLAIYLYWSRIVPASPYSNSEAALAFFTGYLIEKSLSVDNIFVFVLIFASFKVPAHYQHRLLFWGVLGALVMRAALILVGAVLIKEFHWILWLFGGFLIFTGGKMAFHKNEALHPEDNPLVKWLKRFMPLTESLDSGRFFVRNGGRLLATPLFVVLLIIESTDLIFAVDSIPAIFAVTQDPLIVYTSNVFAILGLRSLYFLLAGVMDKFHYLKLGLAAVLVFVGVKMLLPDLSMLITGIAYKIPTAVSLSVVAAILGLAVVASMLRARRMADRSRTGSRVV